MTVFQVPWLATSENLSLSLAMNIKYMMDLFCLKITFIWKDRHLGNPRTGNYPTSTKQLAVNQSIFICFSLKKSSLFTRLLWIFMKPIIEAYWLIDRAWIDSENAVIKISAWYFWPSYRREDFSSSLKQILKATVHHLRVCFLFLAILYLGFLLY